LGEKIKKSSEIKKSEISKVKNNISKHPSELINVEN